MCNQGNQDSSGNQKNVIRGHSQNMENRHTQQQKKKNIKKQNNTYNVTKINEQLGLSYAIQV